MSADDTLRLPAVPPGERPRPDGATGGTTGGATGGATGGFDLAGESPAASWDRDTDAADLPGPGRGGRGARRTGVAAGVLLGVLLVLYLADLALTADRVPRGVSVEGVQLGGQSRADAARTLETELGPRLGAPIAARADGEPVQVDPTRAGLTFDAEATVRQLGGQPLNPLTWIRSFFVTTDAEPVTRADPARMTAEVRALAARIDRPAREGAVRFTGLTPVEVMPQTGRVLQQSAAAQELRQGFLERRPVELPVTVQRVRATPEQVSAAMRDLARPAVAAPVTLAAGDARLVVPPAAIATGLTLTPGADGALAPRLDVSRLTAALGPGIAAVAVPPRDASFAVSGEQVRLVPAVAGRTVDVAKLPPALLPVLSKPAPRAAVLPLVVAQPKFTTAQAQALGIREQISTFTTRHPCCANRVQNIHRVADIVDGTIVRPGETWSMNESVGRRDRARGFVAAPMISEGQFVDAVGGGVSQFATTLFNAVFFAGLEDVQHQPHSYYISRYPPGRESTVSYPEPDFRFRNDSPHAVLISTSYTDTSITVSFFGTKRYDVESVTGERRRLRPFGIEYVTRDDCTPTAGEYGFDITVTRVFKSGGRVVKTEDFETRYLPEPNFICGPPPTPTASASPSAAASGTPSPTPAAGATPSPSPTPAPAR